MNEVTKELMQKIQSIVYDILSDVDDYCKKNHIIYYLSGGTCLGAVRHKGFIPWDDDGDIMMPRKDYERFLLHFGKAYKGKYQVGSLLTDEQWQRPYARIWDLNTKLEQTKVVERNTGVCIDVFPIDGLPDKTWKQMLFFHKIKILNVLRNATCRKDFYSDEKYRTFKRFLGSVMKPFKPRFFAKWLDNSAKKYDFDTSRYVAVSLALHYGSKEKIARKYMQSAVYLPFGKRSFPVPNGYKQYLRNLYGDYMKIPKDAAEKGYSHLEAWNLKFNLNEGEES